MPVRVALVDGVVVGVGVAVGADAGQVRIPIVRADESAHMRVIEAGVEIQQARRVIAPLADVALGLVVGACFDAGLAIGVVDGARDLCPRSSHGSNSDGRQFRPRAWPQAR